MQKQRFKILYFWIEPAIKSKKGTKKTAAGGRSARCSAKNGTKLITRERPAGGILVPLFKNGTSILPDLDARRLPGKNFGTYLRWPGAEADRLQVPKPVFYCVGAKKPPGNDPGGASRNAKPVLRRSATVQIQLFFAFYALFSCRAGL